MTHPPSSPVQASLVTESLRVSDPRQFGPTTRSPLLTKKARALAVRAPAAAIQEFVGMLQEHLVNHEDDVLREALAACPDQLSYNVLFGFLAREACQWVGIDGHGEPDLHCLFGIPLTLHAPVDAAARSWQPEPWGPDTNAQDLDELRRILAQTGVTTGMRDLTILPHLVDPEEFLGLSFSSMRELAPALVHHRERLTARELLPARPWQPFSGAAQCRVLVMAARCRGLPHGLQTHNERCTLALNQWVARCFSAPSTVRLVASSPERVLSLVTGKGLHMFNCARLVHLMGLDIADGARPVSPFMSMEPVATQPGQGELRFSRGHATAAWQLHGRSDWMEDMHALRQLLPDTLARFVRTQLGLQAPAAAGLDDWFED